MAEKSLTLKVYESIKNQLIALRYPPGSYIRERDVAEMLGVSRTPVREAFQRLHHEGWLNIGDRKKIQVCPVTMADIEEIFRIRSLVERFSFDWIMQNGEPRVVAGLADSILSSMSRRSEDYLDFTFLDLQFHSTVIKSSGFNRIYRFWSAVHEEAVRLGFMAMQGNHRFSEVLKEHSAIVESLWNKDRDSVLKAVDVHLNNTKAALLSRFGSDHSPEMIISPLKDAED